MGFINLGVDCIAIPCAYFIMTIHAKFGMQQAYEMQQLPVPSLNSAFASIRAAVMLMTWNFVLSIMAAIVNSLWFTVTMHLSITLILLALGAVILSWLHKLECVLAEMDKTMSGKIKNGKSLSHKMKVKKSQNQPCHLQHIHRDIQEVEK